MDWIGILSVFSALLVIWLDKLKVTRGRPPDALICKRSERWVVFLLVKDVSEIVWHPAVASPLRSSDFSTFLTFYSIIATHYLSLHPTKLTEATTEGASLTGGTASLLLILL